MPSGKQDVPLIEDNHDGTVSIKYEPREEGSHELVVKYNGEHVQGSPYKFHVDSLSSGSVTAYGPGLAHGVSGEPSHFTISTKGAGGGGLSMAVEGPSKAEITAHDNKDGTVAVSYLPTAPGEYKISVRFGSNHIKGSPFVAKVTGEGRKRNQISVGSCSEVTLPGKISDSDIRSLNASIQAPSGLEEPCFLKRLPSGNIGISFTPREVGEHTVSVKKMGKHITNSPFRINVATQEVGDAKKVQVQGNALKEAKTHVENIFTVDTRSAGYGGLSLSIEGPSKAEINCQDSNNGVLKIGYKPSEPGYYIINLKFADHHVEGSPFTVKVTGEGSNRQREKIQRKREAVPITEVGTQCRLTFKMPGITSFDLASTVTSPGGVSEDAEIQEVEDGLYSVHFVPKELGVHTVSVKYREIHIPGSPFQFTVGPLRDSGAHLVKAGGTGLERGEQKAKNEFNVWTREAGGGSLAISVEGPSKAEIEFKDRRDGSCDVSYKVDEPGEYRIGLKFNEQHIPDSPFRVWISPAVGDAHLLEVAQFPEGLQVDKPAQFYIRLNGAKGDLDARIKSPSGQVDDCFIQNIDGDQYSIRFMPRENGIHNIHVKFNGVHIPASPLRVKVGKDDADPAAVHAHGNGLHEIRTGQKTDLIIDTCNAGAGTLAVTVDGPSRVAMDCTEVEEGYKVRYTPLVPGFYYMSIKYNGAHIVGSPFKIECIGDNLAEEGAQETSSVIVETVQKLAKNGNKAGSVLPHFKSDASKVTSKGMGLKKAYLNKQNQFTVCATDAGNNILYVGVYGPKGPCDEVYVKHKGKNNYECSYLVRDRGEYLVLVKWGDDHIPGSPYKVQGNALKEAKTHVENIFTVDTRSAGYGGLSLSIEGITSFDLASTVTSPGGVSEDAEIQEVEDGLYSVHFVPKELGVHTVSVKYREIHIPGSPFQFTVGPLRDSGAHLVKAGGTGLERGEQKAKNEFNVWTREAGGGSLAISVEGPSKAEIEFKDRRDGSCDVSYKVDEPGEYRIGLKFNEQHIPDSPFRVWISPAVGDAHLLEVAQFPEGLQVDKPAQFYIRLNGAKGDLDARIKSPSGQVDDCFIQNIDGDQYSIRFMPRENGIHNMHVKFNGVHIPASPLRVKVGKDDADPAAVHAHGNGLHEIRTGQKTDLIIDTCNAGAGTLAVTVDGPSRVAMDCTEVEEGYKVRYTPLVPGFYYMSIKYNGAHIVGSPFKIECIGDNLAEEGAQETSSVIVETVQKLAKNGNKAGSVLPHFKSDASKVTSKGMGLKKAYLNKQNQFTVCATDAGNNILYVGVYGPKGPCDEVYVKHKGKNNCECSYLVRDRGEYLVLVKWGDDHIPGSPYKVEL